MTETVKTLEFDNNRHLATLFGEGNQNLKALEEKFDVSIISRGNQLKITGAVENIAEAEKTLLSLYQRLENDMPVTIGEVKGAARMLANGGNDQDLSLKLKTQRKVIMPRSPNQAEYIRALNKYDLTFGLGPAGTGKTYLAVAKAVEMLIAGKVERLILSRPAVEAGENLGFLPGDMREKIDPYLRPLYDALNDMLPPERVQRKMEEGQIEVAPLAFMRGRTLSNAFVILDEAQNTTSVQMQMILTRMGEGTRMAVTGDLSQVDLPKNVMSGLRQAVSILKPVKEIGMIEFDDADVVRHPLVAKIVRAYRNNQ